MDRLQEYNAKKIMKKTAWSTVYHSKSRVASKKSDTLYIVELQEYHALRVSSTETDIGFE